MLLRDKRDRTSTEDFFRQALAHTEVKPKAIQKCLESFEAPHTLRRGTVTLRALVPGYRPTHASEHAKVCTMIVAIERLGTQQLPIRTKGFLQ